MAVYYIINPAEVSTNLARFDGIRYGLSVNAETIQEVYSKTRGAGFGPEVRRRILVGTFVLSSGYADAYYRRAREVRELIRADFTRAFDPSADGVDAIVTPTTPGPAFKFGEKKRPSFNVSRRHLHRAGEPRWRAGDFRAEWYGNEKRSVFASRVSDYRRTRKRGNAVRNR